MSNSRRIVLAAALGSSILAAAPSYAQDTVGPPALSNFSLGGQRTTTAPTPPPPPAPAPAPAPAAERPRPTPAPAPAPARPTPRAETPALNPAAPPPAAEDLTPVAPPPVVEQQPVTPVPEPALPPQSTGPLLGPDPVLVQPDAPEPSEFPWRYLLGGAGGLALLALGFFVLRSRRRAVEERVAEPIYLSSAQEPPEPFVPPVAVPEAAPEPEPARPWLELEFKPGKIAATDERASLDYELAVKNMGGAPARNVRIEARMINAGRQQDQEINAFFQAPGEKAVRAPRPLPPGDSVVYRDTVGLPKTEVREVEIQGRRLFIPLVAFNVIYDFGDGQTGQTSMSYLVGREAEPPSEKMAAFRLDLGPRIWRSVGFRPNPLALTV